MMTAPCLAFRASTASSGAHLRHRQHAWTKLSTRPAFSIPQSRRFSLDSRLMAQYAASNEVDEASDEGGVCVIPAVSVNNEGKYTELKIEVLDYPGLLRVVSWVLNGMGMRVHNAKLKTTEDGVAEDTFWLTDYVGKKLSDNAADSLAERLQDYIHTCTPNVDNESQREFTCGNVVVSNTAHEKYTSVVIKGEPDRKGFLLEVASLITGIGLEIAEADIKGGEGSAEDGYDFTQGRLFRFWVTDPQGNKMDYPRIAALLYTLRLVMGKGSAPTTPPNLDIACQ